jgi:peptide/nickel transport system substrate-binding protein
MKKFLMLFLTLVTVLALAAACAPAPAAETTTPAVKPPPAANTTAPAPTTPAQATTPAAPAVKTGGILRTWVGSAPGGFDVHRKPGYGPIFGNPVFNNLIRFDPDKAEISPATIVPDLADRWETSTDGKTLTFYLHKGVKWHDGTPFTSDDVVYSFNKMMDPKQSSLPSSMPAFDRIEKTDELTVKIYLKDPSPSFMVQVAGPYANIQPKSKATVDWRSTDFLVGTGPFKFKSATAGVSYDLMKNPDYFKPGLPYLDGINISIVTDRSAQVSAYVAGKFDVTNTVVGIANQEQYEQFSTQVKGAIVKSQAPQQGTVFWYNMTLPVFKDVRVRKAIALMVDPREMTIAGYGNEGFGEYDHAFMPGSYGLPKAEFEKLLGRDKAFAERVTEAKKLLADAGMSTGLKFKVTTVNTPEYIKRATLLSDLCRRNLGVEVEIVPLDATAARTAREKGDYQLFFDQTLNPLGEPDEVMSYFMTGSSANFIKYSNPELDKLGSDQSKSMDITKRKQLTQQIEKILLTDLPAVPICFSAFYIAWQPNLKGFIPQQAWYTSNSVFEKAWLDK